MGRRRLLYADKPKYRKAAPSKIMRRKNAAKGLNLLQERVSFYPSFYAIQQRVIDYLVIYNLWQPTDDYAVSHIT